MQSVSIFVLPAERTSGCIPPAECNNGHLQSTARAGSYALRIFNASASASPPDISGWHVVSTLDFAPVFCT